MFVPPARAALTPPEAPSIQRSQGFQGKVKLYPALEWKAQASTAN
ncbi:MAG: hypothetical protein ACREFL_06475 [Stellaceae bacterium]